MNKTLLQKSARILSLTALSQNLMVSDAFKADFNKERPICERVARLLTRASTLTITTAAGTRLAVSVKGRKGNAHIGIGTSINLGGRIKASTHFDALMNKPTIRADETVILKNGRLLV